MSNKQRWRFGPTDPVKRAVDSETLIEIGDLVFQSQLLVWPASEFSSLGGPELEAMRKAFSALFLGVAMTGSERGKRDPIRVARSGVFQFDIDPRRPGFAFAAGTLIGPAWTVTQTGKKLNNQRVSRAPNIERSIGKVARRKLLGQAGGALLVAIASKYQDNT